MIRAKFRCMSIAKDYRGCTTVKLSPVIPKKGLPNFEENRKFWEYSPSGECALTFTGDHQHLDAAGNPFEEGSFYFIDMERRDTTLPWVLSMVSRWFGGNAEVTLSIHCSVGSGLESGWLKIGLSEKATDARDQFGEPSDGWSVRFSFAHGPEVDEKSA